MDAARTLDLPTDRVLARVEGPVGWLVFNNPARRNAVSLDMWQAMGEAVERFTADDDVRVIVLRGAGGRAFVSGADISQFEEQRASADAVAAYDAVADRATRALETTHKPTIAMIEGWCIGGGMGIAITCDLRVATDGAKFGIPAARLGLGYNADGVAKLMALVGPAATREIFYTARHFTAGEALRMGLVNQVVPNAGIGGAVRDLCETIAENAPLTITAIKRTVAELSRTDGAPDSDACAALVAGCFASEDYVEGRRAFMEKRRPVFRGR